MGVGDDFRAFCSNLGVPAGVRTNIAYRYGQITRRLNLDLWNVESYDYHSIYTGSYCRGTAIGGTSAVDMIFWLPFHYYERYNDMKNNDPGQQAEKHRKVASELWDVRESLRDGPADDRQRLQARAGRIERERRAHLQRHRARCVATTGIAKQLPRHIVSEIDSPRTDAPPVCVGSPRRRAAATRDLRQAITCALAFDFTITPTAEPLRGPSHTASP
jgi:hypothetical protein